MPNAKITGTGWYVPDNVVTNDDLSKVMDTNDQWIVERTGIKERRWVKDRKFVGAAALAEPAARMALEKAGKTPADIDLIVFSTMTPDYVLPASSCILQKKLGAVNAGAFDVVAACSGFIYGLSCAEKFVKSGMNKCVLMVGAELFSNRLDPSDRSTTVLFGDGAGAVVIEPTDEEGGILSTHVHADGGNYEILYVPAGGSYDPISKGEHERIYNEGLQFLQMKGQELFKIGVQRFSEAIMEALTHNGFKIEDIDVFIPHQANARIIEMVARRMKLRPDQSIVNIDKYGNTTAASIPIALCEALDKGMIKKGDLVVMAAFGSGLTWGSAAIRWI
ncbi:MAG: ketoacyl-ACP synthase III [Planctomycetes bacterium]|nr:ketoacyl-ACP synthase III [Planctomycetota bacterium]